MTAMSDIWIKERCTGATHYIRTITSRGPVGYMLNSENAKEKTGFTLEELMDPIVQKPFVMDVYKEFTPEEQREFNMITPFVGHSVNKDEEGKKIPSYGLSSYGYDVRLGRDFKFFKRVDQVIDVCDFDPEICEDVENVDEIIMEPGDFVLGHTLERFVVPRDVMVIFMAKSTIARCGLSCVVTPGEPGWEGYITIEMFNPTQLPIRVKSGIGIMQAMFFQGNEPCAVSYADRNGKYQGQGKTPVTPR